MAEPSEFETLAPMLDYYGYINPHAEQGRSDNLAEDWHRMFPQLSAEAFCQIMTRDIPPHREVKLEVAGIPQETRDAWVAHARNNFVEAEMPEDFILQAIAKHEHNTPDIGVMYKVREGEKPIGQIQLKLWPEKQQAAIDVAFMPEFQGTPIVKSLWRNTIALCDQANIRTIDMSFEVRVLPAVEGLREQELTVFNGLYSALRIGAVPKNWERLRAKLSQKFEEIRPQIQDPLVVTMIEEALASPDPKAAWAMADCKYRITVGDKKTSVGKALLVGVEAEGSLDLTAGSPGRERLDRSLQGREQPQWVDKSQPSGNGFKFTL